MEEIFKAIKQALVTCYKHNKLIMNAIKVFSLVEKIRKAGIEIRFLPKEEAINHNGICVYTENGIPKGVYIPFSEITKLGSLVEEMLKKDES